MIDQALLSELQYALIEPPDGGQSWPSGVWTREEVIGDLNAGERNLLRRAHLLITRTELAVSGGDLTVALPADWLATAQMTWRSTANVRTPLLPLDATEIDLGEPLWIDNQDTPKGYLDCDGETLTFRLGPTPDDDGIVELLYVAVPTAINGNGRSFTVPDDYLNGVKYAALGTLLRKVGRLQDPARAQYCEERAEMAVVAAEIILGGFA